MVLFFHTLGSVGTKPQLKKEYLPWKSFVQGLEDHLCVFGTSVQTIGTLWHVFETTSTKKEVAFEDGFNAKVEALHLKNKLHQARMQIRQDALMI